MKLDLPKDISVSNFAYNKLKKEIMNLTYKPGQRITENVVSKHLGVSRTPIREAFLKLSEERLIEVYPQRGTYVSRIDKKMVEESIFIRKNLEMAIINLALKNFDPIYLKKLEENLISQKESMFSEEYVKLFDLDQEFHKILFAGVDKLFSWDIIENSMINYNRCRMLSLISYFNWKPLITQHQKIYKAIEKKEMETGLAIMEEHLSLLILDLERLQYNFPEYF